MAVIAGLAGLLWLAGQVPALAAPVSPSPSHTAPAIPHWPYQVLRQVPREPGHFTQGLVMGGNTLYESTGRYGGSTVRAYAGPGLAPVGQVALPATAFGEGLAWLGGELYQATWREGLVYVYGPDLALRRTLTWPGERWGLAADGKALVVSDGTAQLQFIRPDNGQPLRQVVVTDASGQAWRSLNELEWVEGRLLANVWHRDVVLVIDPADGRVQALFDFAPLAQAVGRLMPGRTGEQVLNGLAWDAARQTLWVTGKDWPVWFELQLTLH